MPLKLIDHLDKKAAKSVDFRRLLAPAPVSLQRAENAYKMFYRFRGKILEEAPGLYELKGLVAGYGAFEAVLRRHRERVKEEIKQERIEPEVGKPVIQELFSAWGSGKEEMNAKRDELSRLAGKLDGYYWAANTALEEIEDTIAHFQQTERMQDDEDWSGREAAKVTPIRRTRSPKKKKAAKKKAAKKATKVPIEEVQEIPPGAEEAESPPGEPAESPETEG